MAGSLRVKFIMTCDLLRSDALLSSRGEPRLLLGLRSAAFMVAAAASECVDGRWVELFSRCGVDMAVAIDRDCRALGLVDMEGGKEFRSGGMFGR